MKKVLAVVTSMLEVEKAMQIIKKDMQCDFIALSLDSEFYLEEKLKNWKNSLYKFLNNRRNADSEYFVNAFQIVNKWDLGEVENYLKNRLGLYLFELERSLDTANKAMKYFKPKKVLIGQINDYPGYSVVNGDLMTQAFQILCQQQKIPYKSLSLNSRPTISVRQVAGVVLKKIYLRKKNELDYTADILILAPPSKLVAMKQLILKFKRERLKFVCLTYNVTFELRRELNSFLSTYLEKERLINNEIVENSNKINRKIQTKVKNGGLLLPIKLKVYRNFIENRINKIKKNELLEIISDRLLAEKVISSVSPKILLTLTDPETRCLPYIHLAKERSIKTISLEHGGDFALIPYSVPESDKYVVWSELAKSRLLSNKYTDTGEAIERSKIAIGSYPFDLKKLSNQSGRIIKNILFLSTVHYFDNGKVMFNYRKLFKFLCEDLSGLKISIRTHPFQNQLDLKALHEKYKQKIIFANNISLEEAISAADLIIFENTSAGYIALRAAKLCVFFNPYDKSDIFKIGKLPNIVCVHDTGDFPKIRYLANNKRSNSTTSREFSAKYMGLDGKWESKIMSVLRGFL